MAFVSKSIIKNEKTILILLSIFLLILLFSHKKTKRLLEVDSLSGLMTKYKFIKELDALLKTAKNNEYILLALDVDNFKNINKVYGTDKGDELLRALGEVLKENSATFVYLCRLQSDQFLAVLKNKHDIWTDVGHLNDYNQNFQENIRKKFEQKIKNVNINNEVFFSVGVYVITNPTEKIDYMIDCVMYAKNVSKSTFGNTTMLYNEEIQHKQTMQNEILFSMANSLENNEFFIVIQPKVELLTGRLLGGEVLVRWKKSDGTYFYPDEFIPLFEANQFIVKLDHYVFDKACEFLKSAKIPMPRISVNVSAVTARKEDFLQSYLDILQQYNLNANQFELELTESALANDFDEIALVCKKIKSAGFYLSLDDFGVGASSFSRIQELQADIIKLDKGFLSGFDVGEKKRIVIENIISMANSLGFVTLAEGIESKENLDFMIDVGCEMGQGYYFNEPLSIEEFMQKVLEDASKEYPNIVNSNEKIKAYFSNYEYLPYGVAIIKNDPYFSIIKANKKFYNIIGHTKKGLLEQHKNRLTEIILDNMYGEIRQKDYSKDFNLEYDLRFSTDKGDIVLVHDYIHYDVAQNLFFATITDITDKMLSSDMFLSFEAYEAQKESLMYLNKHIKEHIIISDVETDEIVYLNNSVMNFFGYKSEEDWKGKKYNEICFGSEEIIDNSYNFSINKDEFSSREYYNAFHKMYLHVENKIITVLGRKMRLNIVSDITAQKKVENEISVQETLHKGIEILYTKTTATEVDSTKTTFQRLLELIRLYYNADKAYLYKLKNGTLDVEIQYEVMAEGVLGGKDEFSSIPIEAREKLMSMLAKKGKMLYHSKKNISSENADVVLPIYEKYNIDSFIYGSVKDSKGNVVGFIGVDNPKKQSDNADLILLLSSFVWLFIKNEATKKLEATAKQLMNASINQEKEIAKLEEISKMNLLEKCRNNLQEFEHEGKIITDILRSLKNHYGAQFVVILEISEDDKTYGVSYESYEEGSLSLRSEYQNRPILAIKGLMKHFYDEFKVVESYKDKAVFSEGEKEIWEKFGIEKLVSAPMFDRNNKLIGILCAGNISIEKRSKAMIYVVAKNISDYMEKSHIYHKINQDSMTGLLNKKATEVEICTSLNASLCGAMFIIDLDNFKNINDTLGHLGGDYVIVNLSQSIKNVFRTTDIIGRIGGDEFMVFCPKLIEEDLIIAKANEILDSCNCTHEKYGIIIESSVSIGICKAEVDDTFLSLYEKTDKELYKAKKNGRNKFSFYKSK